MIFFAFLLRVSSHPRNALARLFSSVIDPYRLKSATSEFVQASALSSVAHDLLGELIPTLFPEVGLYLSERIGQYPFLC